MSRWAGSALKRIAQKILEKSPRDAGDSHFLITDGTTVKIVVRSVFWISWLTFLYFALQILIKSLHLSEYSLLLDFVPKLIGAAFIVIGGWVLASLAAGMSKNAFKQMGSKKERVLSVTLKNVILFLTIILAANQLGFRLSLILHLATILASMIAGSIAISFALGAKDMVKNMLAGQQIANVIKIGETIELEKNAGTIIEMNKLYVVLESKSGKSYIPNSHFFSRSFMLLNRQ